MTEQKHWSQQQETTSTLGIRVLLGIFRLGGRALFHLTLWPVVVFFWLTVARSRNASSAYLRQMARFTGTTVPFLGSLRHLMRFSDTILDKILAVSGSFGAQDLNVVNAEDILDDPRGGVIITAHTGCIELCQVISEGQRTGRTLHVLVHTVHAVRFNKLVRKINPQFAVNHIEVTSIGPQTAMELSDFIDRGDWIVIVADRTPIGSSSTIDISFLGRKAPFASVHPCARARLPRLEHDLHARNFSFVEGPLPRGICQNRRTSSREPPRAKCCYCRNGRTLGKNA